MKIQVAAKTGTYSDALEAIGTASILEELGFSKVLIRDLGQTLLVSSDDTIAPVDWRVPSAGYPYIWESAKEPHPAIKGTVLDYEGEKLTEQAWIAFDKQARKSKGKAVAQLDEQELSAPARPHPSLRTAKMLASMRKGWNSDRDLAKWIDSEPAGLMPWIRRSLGVVDEVVSAAGSPPRPDISSTQIMNPIAGKGINAPKTNWRAPNSPPDALINPFAEWMKMRGLWIAMLPYRSDDDFKFFVIEPRDIRLSGLRKLREEMDKLQLWGGIRLDIESTLRLTELLIRHSDVYESSEDSIRLRRRKPAEVVGGLRQAYFKSLGTAAALMNDALLPLPDWFVVESKEDCDQYLQIIEEALGSEPGQRKGNLGMLDEGHSDEGAILQQYRQWILSSDLFDLLRFHHSYAQKVMQKLAAKEYAPTFGTTNLDILVRRAYQEKYPVTEIIENPGFKSVARAIRNSTIYALGMKNSNREVHFGLAQKWKQKMKGGAGELVAAISEFVQTQNWEVTSKHEGRGHIVTTDDLSSLLSLFKEKSDAELVGSLLLAYGYARAPKIETEGTAQA